jgi:class 3 adenylate cyclase
VRHHPAARRELARFHGAELDTAGDGFFATFDGPARAIRCTQAIATDVGELGLDLRAGLHTGEFELHDAKLAGIAVSIGSRAAAYGPHRRPMARAFPPSSVTHRPRRRRTARESARTGDGRT